MKQSKVFDNNNGEVGLNFFAVKLCGKPPDIIEGTDRNDDIFGLAGGDVIQDSDGTDKIIPARMKILCKVVEVTNSPMARLWMVL